MKFLNKDKNQGPSLDELNRRILDETLFGTRTLNKLVNDYIDGNLNEEDLDKVTDSEHRADRLKEKYIKLLFEDKRALPFLVEDRFKMITTLDKLNSRAEYVARFLEIMPFEVYDDIKEDFKELTDLCCQTVEYLIECMELIEESFDEAYEKTFEVQSLRRKARTINFNLLEIIFKKTDNSTRIYLISKLIRGIYDIIAWAEDLADYLRGLIIKYPSK
jgi:predicted phosphate transport protein (TIGR00153 family)